MGPKLGAVWSPEVHVSVEKLERIEGRISWRRPNEFAESHKYFRGFLTFVFGNVYFLRLLPFLTFCPKNSPLPSPAHFFIVCLHVEYNYLNGNEKLFRLEGLSCWEESWERLELDLNFMSIFQRECKQMSILHSYRLVPGPF